MYSWENFSHLKDAVNNSRMGLEKRLSAASADDKALFILIKNVAINTGVNKIPVTVSALPAGNYTIEIRGEAVNVNMRFTKQ